MMTRILLLLGASIISWAASAAPASPDRIALQPQPGKMEVIARVPGLDGQAFALGIPETVGCRKALLLNFMEAKIDWQGPDALGGGLLFLGPRGTDLLLAAAFSCHPKPRSC